MNRHSSRVLVSGRVVVLALFSLISTSSIAATCNPSLLVTTPDSRFQDNSDQTVSDLSTHLMWARCTIGRTWDGTTCNGIAEERNWQQAVENARDSSLAGYNDWRLPNIKELNYLIERSCYLPAINENFFSSVNGVTDDYWTSTPDSNDGSKAWLIGFSDGQFGVDAKDNTHSVRLVRGGI
ncbi:DUF1566 domain-containing protein [Agarivorans sp. 1_MG-2023]|uniref:Lcl C-terminal domain-containing protein n=1 Tax=Agarivorans sp. 1_MG-2023 TaxID=3062634 RepID=UPI0026E382FC|nr:DUF1566 domain-containing protein [Agarivorans sp. 1_MG-2023]MDO6762553.1 DUF1566 domain-containing protein [Agarivorans sp. 1_MG-2023]